MLSREERQRLEQIKAEKAAKERAVAQKKEMAQILKPVVVQAKVPFGTDPKTVLCAYFKAGVCDKGKSASSCSCGFVFVWFLLVSAL